MNRNEKKSFIEIKCEACREKMKISRSIRNSAIDVQHASHKMLTNRFMHILIFILYLIIESLKFFSLL